MSLGKNDVTYMGSRPEVATTHQGDCEQSNATGVLLFRQIKKTGNLDLGQHIHIT